MNKGRVFADLCSAELIERALLGAEGRLADTGALVALTGKRTGRSPSDRFIVKDPTTSKTIDWGSVNREFDRSRFDNLWKRVDECICGGDRFISHLHVGQNSDHYLPISITTQTAWHALFAQNMFIRSAEFNPRALPCWEILHASGFECDPKRDGVNSDSALLIDFESRRVVIAGLRYAGEIKKAMFSVQNYILPDKDVMPMHCAANVGEAGDTALFFGLSGTGKTTLSADPDRYLIGDDEHGWTDGCVFNLEGGCYAKTINLSKTNEPVIWDAIRFGSILENVVISDQRRVADYSDTSLTENGRCSYPLEHVKKRKVENQAGEPRNIIFLTCDVTGVLPPVSILTKESAAFHFLSGYTARVGSTEVGAAAGIHPTFSTCFGAPFMPRPAKVYAELLMDKIQKFQSRVYLVNTGWTGGSGSAEGSGSRFPIPVTRSIITAITKGLLEDCETEHLSLFNLDIPLDVEGVDKRYLNPRKNWPNQAQYDSQALALAKLFIENIVKFSPSQDILDAGPRIIHS